MNRFAIFPALALVAACAQKPENIAAVDIGATAYRGHSCSQLANVQLKHSQNLANLSAAQNKAADNDAIGVILLGLPLSSMAGGDKETAIAVTKGHLQAIEAERSRKNCR